MQIRILWTRTVSAWGMTGGGEGEDEERRRLGAREKIQTSKNMSSYTYSKRTEIRVDRRPWDMDRLGVYLYLTETRDGVPSMRMAEPLMLRDLKPEGEGIQPQPCFNLKGDEAQQLMDELWRAGIRPTEGAGSVGQLGAVQEHLKDMRTLVFKQHGFELPK